LELQNIGQFSPLSNQLFSHYYSVVYVIVKVRPIQKSSAHYYTPGLSFEQAASQSCPAGLEGVQLAASDNDKLFSVDLNSFLLCLTISQNFMNHWINGANKTNRKIIRNCFLS